MAFMPLKTSKESIMCEAKIEKLASFLNLEKKEVSRTNADTQYKCGNKSYMVLSEKEVKQDWFAFAKSFDCLMADENFSIFFVP